MLFTKYKNLFIVSFLVASFFIKITIARNTNSSLSEKSPITTVRKTIMNFDHLVAFQYFPMGLVYKFDGEHRFKLFPNKNPLLNQAYIGTGLAATISPSFISYGPILTIAPLTILRVKIQFNHLFSGVTSKKLSILDYSSLGQYADYSYSWRNDNGKAIGEQTAKIWSLHIKPVFLFKLWKIILVHQGDYFIWRVYDSFKLYYNYLADMITTDRSWVLKNDTILLFEILNLKDHGRALRIGLSNQFVTARTDNRTPNFHTDWSWRIGLLTAWTIKKEGKRVNIQEPTLLLYTHYFGKDTSRKRRYFHILIAFKFATNWYKK